MRLAIVGIRGIPNNYGGFETLAEYLVEHFDKDIELTVFCSSKDMDSSLKSYKGAKLRYLPISSHGASGILYDSLALLLAVFSNDKVLFLGFGGGFIIPFLGKFKSKIILNIGGLDWKRDKWSPFAKMVIRFSEAQLVKNSSKLIADNAGISDYLLKSYGKKSQLIAYGGDQAQKIDPSKADIESYPFLKGDYAFSVTRIQIDNNIDMILDAFNAQNELPLVMVGNWNNSEYGIKTKEKYRNYKNLVLLDAIYDREKLDVLRSNCSLYIHGHSAGGTNPSLVEAMYLGLPIFAFASGYNEYTTENRAIYFDSSASLLNLIDTRINLDLVEMGKNLKQIADKSYRWKTIAEKYRELILS
jgi:glycosyltransferase involved in cell wall biosynthesis